jgi:hypothetical protein
MSTGRPAGEANPGSQGSVLGLKKKNGGIGLAGPAA